MWSTDDRLSSHVETGVDDQSKSGLSLKFLNQCMIPWVGFFMDSLNSGRKIKVSYGLNITPLMVKLFP